MRFAAENTDGNYRSAVSTGFGSHVGNPLVTVGTFPGCYCDRWWRRSCRSVWTSTMYLLFSAERTDRDRFLFAICAKLPFTWLKPLAAFCAPTVLSLRRIRCWNEYRAIRGHDSSCGAGIMRDFPAQIGCGSSVIFFRLSLGKQSTWSLFWTRAFCTLDIDASENRGSFEFPFWLITCAPFCKG